jgi:hypothetical protein
LWNWAWQVVQIDFGEVRMNFLGQNGQTGLSLFCGMTGTNLGTAWSVLSQMVLAVVAKPPQTCSFLVF